MMMLKSLILQPQRLKYLFEKYLLCPICKSDLKYKKKLVCVSCGEEFNLIDNTIPDLLRNETKEDKKQQVLWNKHYLNKMYLKRSKKLFVQTFLYFIIRQLKLYDKNFELGKGRSFLEIGCGLGHLAGEITKRGWFFIGLDFSTKQLLAFKSRMNELGIDNYLVIRADMRNIPLKSEVVDYVFGLGVIEHVKSFEVSSIVCELYRVLKKKGISFNSVPVFNLGNMLYRSMWGGIPNVSVLKQVAEFVHIRLLKERRMRFGYELQFTPTQMREIHRDAGFRDEDVFIDRFEHKVLLKVIKNRNIRSKFVKLCERNKFFWPMIRVVGIKN